MSKARDNRITEIIKADRKEMIEMASDIINKDPRLTVILANPAGDVVGMSRTEDMSKAVLDICRKAGGSGGGKPEFAQGRADPSKLMKTMQN
jgi:alanyl-tRNA synthetase